MKVVILAGGFGTRISEETYLKPKPMIEIGEMPIIWHIMKLYSYYGYKEFVICAGYKQHVIKEWFQNYYYYNSDITIDYSGKNKSIIRHKNNIEPWKVTIVNTGENTLTGGRIKRVRSYLENETFFLTYGDGVSDVNINNLLKFHREQNKLCTVTAIKPEGRFGILDVEGKYVRSFREKGISDTGWINAGFMVVEPKVLDYIKDDETVFEKEPLEKLADEGNLICFKHNGFWKCIDTLKDKIQLESFLKNNTAPWMIWKENSNRI